MIRISTFNIQNDIKNYSIEKTDILFDYLKNNHIDILNLQEVYSSLEMDLNSKLRMLSYTAFGLYRFSFQKLFNRINEKTPIITRYPVIFHRTYHLPFLPSLLKRVLTKVVVIIDGREVSVYNTHLDYKYNFVKKRQLKRILSLLKNDTNPIILTGDFNLKTNRTIFLDFIDQLEQKGLQHIDIREKTLKASRYHRAIDHIFVSKDFRVLKKELITNLSISDHYPILLDVEFCDILQEESL